MCERVNEQQHPNAMITRTFKWAIDNFSKESLKCEPIVSRMFEYKFEDMYSEAHYTSMWILRLYPNGFNDESKGYVCFELTLHANEVQCDLRTDCKLSILKSNNEETNSRYDTLNFEFKESTLTRRLSKNFIKLDCILKSSNGLLSNDRLTLLFSIGVQKGRNIISMEEITYKSRLQLADDFECFYNSKEFNDVTFTVGDKEFQANKSILAARSPIFFSMFSLDMKEKHENSVKINDVDPKVFKELLKFIYSGKLPKRHFIEELFVVADKYAIEGLQDVCEKYLSNGIRIKNAINILQLADAHNAFDLKKQATQFIVEHAQYIIGTHGFKNIGPSQVHLIKELFCALAEKHKNEAAIDPSKCESDEETEN